VVVEPNAFTPGGDNAPVGQALKLIGDCLRRHAQLVREIRDAQFSLSHERVQQPEPSVVRECLEQSAECLGIGAVDQRPRVRAGLAMSGRYPGRSWYAFHTKLLH
jgi:hypothetical protein